MELYSTCHLCKSTYLEPNYFSTGECLTNIADQTRLVDDLVGESSNLPEDTAERRQCNYKRFMRQERDDGGYSKFDVPRIAYDWRDIWGANVKVNLDYNGGGRGCTGIATGISSGGS